VDGNVFYLSYADFLRAAAQALRVDLDTVRQVADRPLAESALAPPPPVSATMSSTRVSR